MDDASGSRNILNAGLWGKKSGWMLVSAIFILAFLLVVTGIVYIGLHFSYVIYDFARTRVDILMIKHILLFITVCYGIYLHLKLKNQFNGVNN